MDEIAAVDMEIKVQNCMGGIYQLFYETEPELEVAAEACLSILVNIFIDNGYTFDQYQKALRKKEKYLAEMWPIG